tara:strand:- start:8631 stop:9341 length:711 start_codon:yes stop_codon:yes gene_type:complete
MKATESRIPKHVGVILDGNRRFSKRLMMKPWKGHEWGAQKVEKLLDWAMELGIKELTLFCFSVENFSRPKVEFDYLMGVFDKEFTKLLSDDRLEKNGVRLNFIGRTYMFPKSVQEKIKQLMEMTSKHSNYVVNFAMGYGGRQEVVDAVKKVAESVQKGDLKVDDINEESFSKNLYMEDEPELIIRTGGAKRTSNFLIWQSHYSEWIFLDKFWPEFEKEDFIECIQEYGKRERRFGK